MSEEATIYVVDADPAAREAMAAMVRSKGLQVHECESAEAFLNEFRPNGKTCLVTEVHLPDMSGLELQQRLKIAGKQAPVVMVSDRGDIRTAVLAMKQGAVSFLEKPCNSDELSAAIDEALEQSAQQHQRTEQNQALRDRFAQLTPSEREVLSRVIEGQPNRRIAKDLDIGLRTVELRRSHIMRKTGANSLSELIRLAIDVNFPEDLPTPATVASMAESA